MTNIDWKAKHEELMVKFLQQGFDHRQTVRALEQELENAREDAKAVWGLAESRADKIDALRRGLRELRNHSAVTTHQIEIIDSLLAVESWGAAEEQKI